MFKKLLPLLIMVPITMFASGCVEGETVESPVLSYDQSLKNGNGNGPVDCSLVLCYAVECPEGTSRHYTPSNCCGTCIPDSNNPDEGSCKNAQQCENAGLIHIQCVGSWSCDAGKCAYTCDTTAVTE